MRRFDAYRAQVPLAIAVLCLCVAACGKADRGASSAFRSSPNTARSRSVVASKPSGAIAPSPSITGDYDSDDNYGHGPFNDGDDDDSKPSDRDGDSDNSSGSYYDSDDNSVRGFGHAADAADRKAIVSLVRRYLGAAAAEDGATACALVLRSEARAVPEDYGRPPAPPYARGTTCAAVMSMLFAHYHRQLAAHAAPVAVGDVRVDRGEGVAVLAFRALPGRQMRVIRDGRAWRVEVLFDTELP
ncbi:MAG: hypothetical protein WA484_13345 [Solirubrobacteraceae bacterium]